MELQRHGHEVIPVGLRQGTIGKVDIRTDRPEIENVDTVTLYVGPQNQESWFEYILSLSPKRVILNPGTENAELINTLDDNDIKWEEACTLVLLTIGSY
jgi:predicted CoA-binding protein